MAKHTLKDPRGAHVRLYHDILQSCAWKSLSATDQRAYLALHLQRTSFNNGDLSLPISYARHQGITSETTLAKNLRALQAVGLVAVTVRTAHRSDGSRLPNLYRMTDFPVFAMPKKHIDASPATNEWKQIKSKAQGQALIRKAEEANAAAWKLVVAERAKRQAGKGVRN